MENTTFPVDWVAALAAMPAIAKDQKVDTGQYSYKYANLPDIRGQVVPVLAEHNLAYAQDVTTVDGSVSVTTRFYHTSGHVEVFGPLELKAGSTAQQAGSAITYARRYALEAALGLAAQVDDDGALASAPKREDLQPTVGQFLRDRVAILKEWDSVRKAEAYKQAMDQLAIGSLDNLDDAERVFEFMAGVYYEEHPESGEAPF